MKRPDQILDSLHLHYCEKQHLTVNHLTSVICLPALQSRTALSFKHWEVWRLPQTHTAANHRLTLNKHLICTHIFNLPLSREPSQVSACYSCHYY